MKRIKRLPSRIGLFMVLAFLVIGPLKGVAQTKTVTGLVLDASSEKPVAGASVLVKGSTAGTLTNAEGRFSVVVPENGLLLISAVGYQELEVGADASLNRLLLSPVNKELDQVVVVGYGRQKKATLTGAVETISSKTFESRAVTNVGLALQGQVPGLLVTRSSPRPGNEGIAFTIRGATSVNGSDPLIVVDGVPILNAYSFQNMNPDDIESISVLKDGASAIYGSRASNGVILVTTKRGKGKVRVDYSGNFRFTTNGITGYSPSMQEYATMWLEANKEEAVPNWWVWSNEANLKNMQQGVEGKYDLFGTDFYIYNADRIAEMFARRYSYQHNISVSNSGEKSGYRLSLGYSDNQGNLATAYDGQKQYNLRFNHDYKLSDKLKLETGVSLINAATRTPSVGLDNTLYAFDMPFYPAKNPLGQWFATFNGIDGGAIRNAAAMTSAGGRDNKNSLTGRIDLKATYEIYKDLALEGMASLQNERFNEEKYVLPVQLYNWYGVPTGIGLNTGGTSNTYYAYAWQGYYQYYSTLLRYNKIFKGRHNVSAVAGINAEKNTSQWISGNRVGFDDMGVYDISVASTTTQTNAGSKSLNGRYSYISRLNYNYDEKYLAELIGRRDGNSRFAAGYKFKNFGSALLGWVFTKEKFMEGTSGILNFGKIRASYGVLGNEASGLSAFDYLSTVNIGTTILGSPAAQQQSTSLNNNGLISYTRSWERVKTKNIGVDLNFLRNRLTANFDYFIKDNIGMLVDVTYPSVLGGKAPKTNSGRFNTKGWEAVLNWKDHIKEFSYYVSVNMGNTQTRISGVEGADNYGAGLNGIVNGYPWKPWFVYATAGYFKNQAEVDAYYKQFGGSTDLANLPQTNKAVALRPGDVIRTDVAGTGNITAIGNKKSALIYVGDGTPHYTYGMNLGGSWKGVDLDAFFQGQLKQHIMRNGYMAYPFAALYTNQNPSFLGNTWTEENTTALYPRLTVSPARASWNYANNDFMLQNNRYIRLKTLIVGYTLPPSLTQRIKLQKLRVYFSGNDLWEATSVKDGFDPEMGEASINSGYPFARTWSFGINVGF
ncbi:SusC/RagA family TonB-linked outer membrane protein [Niabella hirudinis]|uniref:SusC/RagA family TonB-linked outer membrane protein n=1 Tax=Niabella hirudinis TaxID=1285929 RepID=UPI003EBBCC21